MKRAAARAARSVRTIRSSRRASISFPPPRRQSRTGTVSALSAPFYSSRTQTAWVLCVRQSFPRVRNVRNLTASSAKDVLELYRPLWNTPLEWNGDMGRRSAHGRVPVRIGQRGRILAPTAEAGATGNVINGQVHPDGRETYSVDVPGGSWWYEARDLEE